MDQEIEGILFSRVGTLSGSGHPPRARTLLDLYESQTGMGILLHASRTSSPGKPIPTSAQQLSPALEKEIAELVALGPSFRVLTATTPFVQNTQVRFTHPVCRIVLGNGESIDFKIPTTTELEAAVDVVIQRLPEGKGLLPLMTAEAEDPGWALMSALDMVSKKPSDFDRTCELFDVVCDVVTPPVFAAKSLLNIKRPDEVKPLTPWIPVPRHRSMPSGHAAIAFALAKVLSKLTGAPYADLVLIAQGVAERRERAGVHTALDTAEGKRLGETIGKWMNEMVDQTAPPFVYWAALFRAAAKEW